MLVQVKVFTEGSPVEDPAAGGSKGPGLESWYLLTALGSWYLLTALGSWRMSPGLESRYLLPSLQVCNTEGVGLKSWYLLPGLQLLLLLLLLSLSLPPDHQAKSPLHPPTHLPLCVVCRFHHQGRSGHVRVHPVPIPQVLGTTHVGQQRHRTCTSRGTHRD